MSTISLSSSQLAARLRADATGAPKAVLKAMKSAAQRGRAFMVSKSPVYRGILRNAWKVIKVSDQQINLENDQPYAGVLERGARPFKLSKEGLEALTLWVKRKVLGGNFRRVKSGGSTTHLPWKEARAVQTAARKAGKAYKAQAKWALDDEAKSIAFAIAKKWARDGKQGKFFIRNNIQRLAELMQDEMDRVLAEFFNRPLGGSSGVNQP